MFGVILGCTIAVGGGYFFYNKKSNNDSKKVAVNNFVFVTNLIHGKKPTSFAVRDNHPTLIFSDLGDVLSYNRVEIKFDANCNVELSYFSSNEDDTTHYIFSNFDRNKIVHDKCVYKNYSKVDLTDVLYVGYTEYYRKFINEVFYALSTFSTENNQMTIFNTILSSFDINHPEDYIKHFLSESKVIYREEKTDSSELITTDKLFEFIDFKLVEDSSIQNKFNEIEQIASDVLKHQKLLSIASLHYLQTALPETLTDALHAYSKMNDKVQGVSLLSDILDNVIEKLNTLNADRDEFYLEKLKNLSTFSQQNKK